MSWDSYLDNLVAQSKDSLGEEHCDKAVIIGMDGGGMWTTSAHAKGMQVDSTEAANIARAFKVKDFTPFMSGGVRMNGTKYQFLREEDKKLVLAKCKGQGALTLQSSKTAIVIGHTAEGKQPGNTNKAVGVIAEYLESLGM